MVMKSLYGSAEKTHAAIEGEGEVGGGGSV